MIYANLVCMVNGDNVTISKCLIDHDFIGVDIIA